MKRSILKQIQVVIVACLLLSSCTGEQGDPGPTGQTGTTGQQGEKGDPGTDGRDGTDGTDVAVKSGFFEGVVSGKRTDGTEFEHKFKFERRATIFLDQFGDNPYGLYDQNHVESFKYVEECDCHQLLLVRQDSTLDGNEPSELGMRLLLKNKGTANEELYFQYAIQDFRFVLLKELSATSIFRLEARGFTEGEDTMKINNYQYDSNTGRMTFEFDIIIKPNGYKYYNSTGNDISISGRFDSGKGKVYKDIVSRKG